MFAGQPAALREFRAVFETHFRFSRLDQDEADFVGRPVKWEVEPPGARIGRPGQVRDRAARPRELSKGGQARA
eukprot:7614749-Lingulodinium_polyedra.AAC.1